MKKLMTKFIFYVHQGENNHHHVVVTRLADSVQKYFFQTHGSMDGITFFMNSMTDELVDSYFPKAHKKGSDVDNWAFLGHNSGRVEAERLARLDLTYYRLAHKI
jgi:hypothetical protein